MHRYRCPLCTKEFELTAFYVTASKPAVKCKSCASPELSERAASIAIMRDREIFDERRTSEEY